MKHVKLESLGFAELGHLAMIVPKRGIGTNRVQLNCKQGACKRLRGGSGRRFS